MEHRVELVHRRALRPVGGLPGLRAAFLRAQLADRLQHRKLAVKVVIEAALGKAHLIQDILHGRLLVALRIKQTFRRGQQLAPARIALLHSII